jgi:hypothetical protein
MVSVYTNHLRLEEIGTGEQSGDWGTTTNTNLELIAEGFSYGTEAIGDADTTITMADGASDGARSLYLKITSSTNLTATRTITLAPNTVSKVWIIENATGGSQIITIKQGTGSGASVNIANGQVKMIATDGGGTGGIVYDLLTDVELAGTTTATALTVDDVAIDGKVITMTGSSGDTAVMTVAADGVLTITTTDGTGTSANITITADGTFEAVGTSITLDSGGDIELEAAAGGDVNIPANIGLTFGDDGEKIEGDGTDLTISGNNINLTAVADVNIPSGVGLTFATAEKIESDGTDLSITVGSGGDINIPADIGVTFGNDGEKIEGDGTDLTISGNNINLTATADVVIPANVGITFGTGEKIEGDSTDLTITSGAKINLTATSDVIIPSGVGLVLDGSGNEKIESDGTDISISVGSGGDINIPADIGVTFGNDGEKIEGNGTDLTISASADLNLTATTDINIPANVGLTFGDDGEKIEGNGTDLTISGNNINLTATADVNIPSGVGLTFATTEKIESDGTDLSITVGSGGDINIPADIGVTFGNDGEKIEGNGTDLTISGNNINLTATADVIIPSGVGLVLDGSGNEKIESDGTDISISVGSGGDINIPANIGVTFGDDGEKIEGDGTDLTISGNNINLSPTSTVTVSGVVDITDTTDSSDATGDTGALRTEGGASIAKKLFVGTDLDVDGTTNLDNTDIDGTLVVDGSNISLDSTTTLNIDNSNTSNGITIGTATSGVPISIGHSSSETTINDNLTVTGNLTINGTTTTVNSTTVTIDDPIFTLGGDSAPGSDDNKDRGIEFRYHDGSAARIGFFGWDDSATAFTFLTAASNSSEVFSGTAGNLAGIGNISIANDGNIGSAGDSDSMAISSSGVVTFSQAPVFPDGSINIADLDIDGGTDIGAAIVDADLFIVDDGAGGTNRKTTASRMKTYFQSNVTASEIAADDIVVGDAAVTIGNGSTSADITIDSGDDIVLDAAGGNIEFKDGGTLQLTLDMDGTAGVQIIQLGVDSDDLVFKQYDGNEVVRIADDRRLYFFDKGGEYIYGDGTDLNIVAGADINIPANVGLTFGDDGEKIEGDGTDLTISGNNINLTATADVVVPANVGITFGTGEKIEGDNTDLTVTSGGKINLTATSDVVVPANVGVTFGTGEKIEGDNTDLTVTSGGKINLTATSDVHIPNNVGIVFGGASEKIEGDGTDMTISSNNLTVDAAADIILDAAGNNITIKSGGTSILDIANNSSDVELTVSVADKNFKIKGTDGSSAITALDIDIADAGAATFSGNVTAFSDRRLKSDIQTLENGLEKVEQLRGVTYTRDDNVDGGQQLGVIAQEIEEVFPQVVRTADDERGTKSVDYGRLTGALIEAVKELSAKVKELEARLD